MFPYEYRILGSKPKNVTYGSILSIFNVFSVQKIHHDLTGRVRSRLGPAAFMILKQREFDSFLFDTVRERI